MNYRNISGLIGYIIELISPPDLLIIWVIVKPLLSGLFYKVSSVIYPEWYTESLLIVWTNYRSLYI